MGLQRFFSLLAASIGLIGAVFLSKGVVILSPKVMLHLTSPYSRYAYAPEQIASMATQKADALIGVVYIFLAFLIQVFSLIFVTGESSFIKSRWMGFWIVFTIVSILTVIFSLINIKIRDYYKLETGKIAVKDYCIKRLERKVIDPVNIKSLETMSQELLNLKKEDSETKADFIKRIAKYVEWTIPDDIDFSMINGE